MSSIFNNTVCWFKGFGLFEFSLVALGLGLLSFVLVWFFAYRKAFSVYKAERSEHFTYSDRVYSFVAERHSDLYNRVDPFYFACWADFYSSKARLLRSYIRLKRLNPFLSSSCPTKYGCKASSEKATSQVAAMYAREGERYYELSYYLSEIGFGGESVDVAFMDQRIHDLIPLKITSKGNPLKLFFSEQRCTPDILKTIYHGDPYLLWYSLSDAGLHEHYIDLKRKLFESYVTLGDDRIRQDPVLVDLSGTPFRNLDASGKLRRGIMDMERFIETRKADMHSMPYALSQLPGTAEPLLFEDIRVPAPTPFQPRYITSRFPKLHSAKLLYEQFMVEFSVALSDRAARLEKLKREHLMHWSVDAFTSPDTARAAITKLIAYNEEHHSLSKLELRRLLYRIRYSPAESDETLRLSAVAKVERSAFVLSSNRRNARLSFEEISSGSLTDAGLRKIPDKFFDPDGPGEVKLNSCIEPSERLAQVGDLLDYASAASPKSPRELVLVLILGLRKAFAFIKDLF